MPRAARIVAPHHPHHVIQRGNRRQPVFFQPNDYLFYLDLLAEWCGRHEVEIWAYCLMPNHVHLIATPPADGDTLGAALRHVHGRYTQTINKREGWTGHLWQGRYASYVMNESHALSAVRYIELNPVRAGLVARAEDYRWSSAAAHLGWARHPVLKPDHPLRGLIGDWRRYLQAAEAEPVLRELERREAKA